MAGAEPRMAAQLRVGGVTAEELNEEQRQVALGRPEIVGIERAQERVTLDARVEQRNDTLECRISTNRFIDCHRRFPVAGKDATHNGMRQAEGFPHTALCTPPQRRSRAQRAGGARSKIARERSRRRGCLWQRQRC